MQDTTTAASRPENAEPDATETAETAASHMVADVPRASADARVDDVIRAMRGRLYPTADTIFVVDGDGRLEGIVRINDLLADGDHCIGDIMEPEHEAVRADDDQEQIAMLAIRLNMIAVPVVDDDNRLIGAVPPEALFRILRAEHMEDLQRVAGITPDVDPPAVASDEPISERIRRRLPWLVFGLAASSIVTFVMAGFEESLSTNVTVAFFVPALVYIAGAIGTQAVSVAVRTMSETTVAIVPLLRDELVIGSAVGAFLGALSAIPVLYFFHDPKLAIAVALAIFGGGVSSAMVGFGLPWAFKRLGSDPALGSGPVCTIIQDVSSLLIYFMLVSVLVL